MDNRILMLIGFVSGSLLFISQPVLAQSLFNFGSSNTTSATSQKNAGTVNPPMSPSDFKSTVNSLSQQNQGTLSQQFSQRVAQQPPLQPASGVGKGTFPNRPAPTTPPPASPVDSTPPPAPASTPATPTPSATNKQSAPTPPLPQTAPPVTPPAPPTDIVPVEGGQPDVYTGFGTGNTNTNQPATTPNNNSGAGLNIKY